ncbi:MAG: HNH endonuclease [Pseudomonadota bacterium]
MNTQPYTAHIASHPGVMGTCLVSTGWLSLCAERGAEMKAYCRTGIAMRCDECGKAVYAQVWQLKKSKNHFCSMPCQRAFRSKNERGENNPLWKGDNHQYQGKDGYIRIRSDNHTKAANGYIKRATVAAENRIGRLLLPGEIVHHINGIKDDDRPENLEAMSRLDHNRHHGSLKKGKTIKIEHVCEQCGTKSMAYLSENRRFCSRSCAAIHNLPRLGKGAKLNPQSVMEIRRQAQNKIPQRKIAAMFGVSGSLIHRVIHRAIWKQV